jgi:hypothetical protein
MTIEEIESACDASIPLDFSRHPLEAPELTLRAMYYPSGFPMELRTNSPQILAYSEEYWGIPEKKYDTKPIRVDIHVVDSDSTECPPVPSHHTMENTMVFMADADSYGVIHMGRNESQISVSQAALGYKSYVQSYFIDIAATVHIRTRYMTCVHAACIALDGHGVLLCGDAGAGKSTLSYACARAGWTYVTDDGSNLLNAGTDRTVIGSCHKIRFRPTAAELFPELEGRERTPHMAGKPSVEIATSRLPNMICARTAPVDFVVFLNRRMGGPPELVPYRKDVARYYMRQLHAPPDLLPPQYQSIERLLTAPILELRYSSLDWAIDRLSTLVREGR